MDLHPIGYVTSPRTEAIDDDWEAITSTITLDAQRFTPAALTGLEGFSHVEVVYLFDRVDPDRVDTANRHPRGNTDWPKVGIFAQRAKNRPNRLGVSIARLLDVQGLTITVRALDAIDASPVLDLKPYMTQFAPRGPIHQPGWSSELMAGYWSAPTALTARPAREGPTRATPTPVVPRAVSQKSAPSL